MIRVYNTLSKSKVPFEPVEKNKVGIYLCGPTVYKPSHIGHMVGPVIFDAIKRYLAWSGYEVTLVINITDVDDKLIAEAQRRDMPMESVASEMIADYMNNLDAMGIDTIDLFPKATEHMDHIIAFTEDLLNKGFAYESEGDVYFEVAKCPEYGKLSHRSLEQMQGEGGDTASRKRSMYDFALWKKAKPGEPSWESPWGQGRPGWHIECSVMSREILGETFEIHGGGLDLIFPHHENEIAQSECRHGKPMARYWMHNGLMQASDEVGKVGGRNTRQSETEATNPQAQEAGKISKSKGASAFHDMLEEFAPETIRFFLLSTHYRRPIDFSVRRIQEVEQGLEGFYRFFKRYERVTGGNYYDLETAGSRKKSLLKPGNNKMLKEVARLQQEFLDAMDDDFNTGGAIGTLFDMLRTLNKFVDEHQLEANPEKKEAKVKSLIKGTALLKEMGNVLGLFRQPSEKPGAAGQGDDEMTGKLLDLLVDIRSNARKNKDFATSDRIRDELAAIGVALEDRPDGTEWTLA